LVTFLLIVHALVAVALLGGITHQAVAACWPARRKGGFFTSFRGVAAVRYTNVNIALYLAAAILGGTIYPAYRVAVRTYLENARLWTANGSFEVKEQFVSIGFGMLPLFWWLWREPLDPAGKIARAAVTAILCFIVWYSFIVGHVLNNIRGLFGQ
jgi:hypothetical protein